MGTHSTQEYITVGGLPTVGLPYGGGGAVVWVCVSGGRVCPAGAVVGPGGFVCPGGVGGGGVSGGGGGGIHHPIVDGVTDACDNINFPHTTYAVGNY